MASRRNVNPPPKPEHTDGFGCLQVGRMRIDGATSSEERTVRKYYRYRDIALESLLCRGGVFAIDGVFRDVVDDNGFAALPDFMADRRLHR